MNIEAITSNDDNLGEGIQWDSNSSTLVWIDMFGQKVHRYNPTTGETKTYETEKSISFAVRGRQGLIIAQQDRVDILNEETGSQTPFVSAERLGLNPDVVTNDGKCDRRGRLWFGTWHSKDAENSPVGGLYSILQSGVVKQHAQGFKLPNGLDWTLDNRTMYLVDTQWNCVFAFDFDIQSGSICRQRKALDFSKSGLVGKPDGLTVDSEDHVWLAFFFGSRVVRYDMRTGQPIRKVDLSPTSIVTCPCFGGPQFEDLYITTGKMMLSDEQRSQQPEAGCVFKVTGLGVKGRPPNIFGESRF